MTLLVLNRRPIVDQIPHWLSDSEDDLVLLTAAEAASSSTDVVAATSSFGYRSVEVLDDYNAERAEQLIADLAHFYGVRRIIGTAEIDVLRAARVRALLGIPGQDITSATAYRDKFRMKSIVAEAGIDVAPMELVESADQLEQFASGVGFPIVVKPVAGGGSAGVRVLGGEKAMVEFIASRVIVPGQLLAEAWLDGALYHVDGLMAGGTIVQCWPSQYRHPNLETVTHSRPLASWMLPEADAIGPPLCRFAAAVVAALPAPDEVTAFHAEIFRTLDDRLVLCEIGSRAGGAGVVATYERALGVNLHAASLRGQAGLDPVPEGYVHHPAVLGGWCWFPPQIGILHRVPQRCPVPGVYGYRVNGRVGVEYYGARSVSATVAETLVEACTSVDLAYRMSQLEQWWALNCEWLPTLSELQE